MKQDNDLDALRDREDFKKLVAELEKKAKAAVKEPTPERLPPPKRSNE